MILGIVHCVTSLSQKWVEDSGRVVLCERGITIDRFIVDLIGEGECGGGNIGGEIPTYGCSSTKLVQS